jgi:hypothetical protein
MARPVPSLTLHYPHRVIQRLCIGQVVKYDWCPTSQSAEYYHNPIHAVSDLVPVAQICGRQHNLEVVH